MMGRVGEAAGRMFQGMPRRPRLWLAFTGWTVKLVGAGAASYAYAQQASWLPLIFLSGVVFGVFLEQLSIIGRPEPPDGWWKNTGRNVVAETLPVALLAMATVLPDELSFFGLITTLVVVPLAILAFIAALFSRERVFPTLARINAKSGSTEG